MFYIKSILIISLVISILGYILSVLKEKYYLKKNIIVIDNKSVKPKDLYGLDINKFWYKDIFIKSGDEIKIRLQEKTYKGIFIGGRLSSGILKVVTNSNEILELDIESINDMKLTREYGRFFTH